MNNEKVELNKITYVEANPDKDFYHSYLCYIPKSIQNAPKKYILVKAINMPLCISTNENELLKKEAENALDRVINDFADELRCVVLVPVFQRHELIYTYSLNRATMQIKTKPMVRLDQQLIQMIEDLTKKCKNADINLEEKILMDGYSASGQFVNRFTAMHPELVKAAAAGSISGMPILPVDTYDGERLIYPVGIADLKEITGKPFDLEQYKKVPQFIYMGELDDNDTLFQPLCLGGEEKELIIKVLLDGKRENPISDMHKMREKSKQVYDEQGCAAKFEMYPKHNHCDVAGSDEIKGEIIAFFKEHIK